MGMELSEGMFIVVCGAYMPLPIQEISLSHFRRNLNFEMKHFRVSLSFFYSCAKCEKKNETCFAVIWKRLILQSLSLLCSFRYLLKWEDRKIFNAVVSYENEILDEKTRFSFFFDALFRLTTVVFVAVEKKLKNSCRNVQGLSTPYICVCVQDRLFSKWILNCKLDKKGSKKTIKSSMNNIESRKAIPIRTFHAISLHLSINFKQTF